MAATIRQGSEVRGQRSEQGSGDKAAANNLFVNSLSTAPALPGPKPEAAPEPLAPPPASDLSVGMAASPATVAPGGTINYTVTLGNTTGTEASNLSFNDIFDTHTTFTSAPGAIKSTPVCRDKTGVSAITTDEDTAIGITLQGNDPDGNAITYPFTGAGIQHGSFNATTPPNLTYTPTLNYNGPDTFTFKVNDGTTSGAGGTGDSNEGCTVNITVNAVNDAPTITYNGSPASGTLSTLTINEDTPKTLNGVNLFSVADADDIPANSISEKINLGVSHGKIQLASTVGLTFVDGTANNSASLHFTGTLTNLKNAINGMTYTPDLDWNSTRGSESLSFTISDQGNTGSGPVGGLSATATLPITVTAVNDKPVVATKNFNVQGNMKITYTINLAANGTGDVTDVDNADGSFTNAFTLTSVTAGCTTVIPAGASSLCVISNIQNGAGTATFDFEPPAGNQNALTLSYTVTDNGNGTPGPQASTPGTINITTLLPVIWFVNPGAGSNGTGTLFSPFNNLTDAANKTVGGSALNQRVFVYKGTAATIAGQNIALQGSTSGTLAQAQAAAHWLIGEGAVASSFDTLMGLSGAHLANTIARPTLSSDPLTANGKRPVIQGQVTMKENTTVNGLNINVVGALKGISATGLVAGASPGSALTIKDVNVTSVSGTGVDISTTSGTSSVTYTTSDGTNSPNIITSVGGIALSVVSTTIGAGGFTFQKISANGGTNGIVLNNTGATAGLTVTGTGSAGTGGTIQNCTQKGADFRTAKNISLSYMNFTNNATVNLGASGTCGDALNGTNGPTTCNANIAMSSVTTATLTNVTATGSKQIGIDVKGGSDLTLTNVTATGNGNETMEDGVQITDLTGTLTVAGGLFKDNASNQFEVQNGVAGPLSVIVGTSTFSNTTFPTGATTPANTTANSGLFLATHSSAVMNPTITNCTVDRIYAQGIRLDMAGASSMTANIGPASGAGNGNTITNSNQAISLTGSNTGGFTYKIRNNTANIVPANVAGGATNQIGVARSTASGTWNGLIENNTVGTVGTANSGCQVAGCDGIDVVNNSAGTHKLSILSNTIRQTEGSGMVIIAGGAPDNSNVSWIVKNNTISNPDQNAGQANPAILIQSGTSVGTDTSKTCLEISGNTISGTWSLGTGHLSSIRVRSLTTAAGSFAIVGFNPATEYPNDPTGVNGSTTGAVGNVGNVADYIRQQNPGVTNASPGQNAASATQGAAAFSNSGGCPLLLAEGGVMAALSAPSLVSSLLLSAFEAVPATVGSEAVADPSRDSVSTSLTQAQLDSIVVAASERWIAAGLSAQQISIMRGIRFEVADLGGAYLGEAGGNRVLIDRNAAGKGWFVGLNDTEFSRQAAATRFYADPLSAPAGHVDLLTAIEHEMGHKLGLDDSYREKDRDSLMYGYLTVGERRLPAVGQAKGVIAVQSGTVHHLELGSGSLPTLTMESGAKRPANEVFAHLTGSVSGSRPAMASYLVAFAPMFSDQNFPVNGAGSGFFLPTGKTITIKYSATLINPPALDAADLTPGPHVRNNGALSGTFGGTNPVNAFVDTTVDLFDTTISVGSSPSSPTAGQAVTYTATIAVPGTPVAAGGGATPTGFVEFKDNSVQISGCAARPVGSLTATCNVTSIGSGPHSITAIYTGDGNFDPANNTGSPLVQNVGKSNTSTTVQTSKSPSNVGENVTFTSTTVSNPAGNPATITGTVDFTYTDAANVVPVALCTGAALSSGQATCQTNTLNSTDSPHLIKAEYKPGADPNFNGSSGTVSQSVTTCATNPVVTKIADTNDGTCDADCSLREAIATACVGNTITFDTGVFATQQTITLTLGELPISQDVTITGPGAALLTVDANDASRVFNISTGIVGISGMTITKGRANDGLPLGAGGNGTNGSPDPAANGAPDPAANGAPTLDGDAGNPGTDGNPGGVGSAGNPGGNGGAILNGGTLTLTGVIVSASHAGNGSAGGNGGNGAKGGNGAAGGNGGAETGANANTDGGAGGNAGDGGAAGSGGNGGAGGLGGGIYNTGTLNLANSTLSGNQTGTGGTGGTVGTPGAAGTPGAGGLAGTGGTGAAGANGATGATGSGGAAGSPGATGFGGVGGGIYNLGVTVITGSTLNANHAVGLSTEGGGIDSEGGTLTITNSTISGNTSEGIGGGLLNCGNSDATLTSVTITGNRSDFNNSGGEAGAGIAQTSSIALKLRNSIVAGNFIGSTGGSQTETATVVAAITTDGNAKVVVTFSGAPGGQTVTVPVTTGDDSSAVAGKMRTALALNGVVGPFFFVTGTADKIVLTVRTAAANDPTPMNIATDNDDPVGVTAQPTSTHTLAGAPASDIFLSVGTVDTANSTFNLIGDKGSSGGLVNGTGNNIVGVSDVGTRDITTVLNTTPASNGGPTQTHALVDGSAAIDSGSNVFLPAPPATDQRGFLRPVDLADANASGSDASDIGAFERQAAAPQPAISLLNDTGTADGITSNTAPSFDISNLVTGSSVQLFRDDDGAGPNPAVVVASGTAPGANMTLTDSTGTSDPNTYSYFARQTAGGPSTDSTLFSVTIDTTAPGILISAGPSPSSANAATGSVTYTVTYSDTNFNSSTLSTGNITLNPTGTANASIGVSTVDATTRTVTLSSLTGTGTLGISIAAGTGTDKAGNSTAAAGPSATFALDADLPSVQMTSSSSNPTNVSPIPVHVVFSESVTGFDATDVHPTNATVTGGSFTGSGTTYDLTLTVTGSGVVNVSANIDANAATDAALNGNTAAAQFNRTFNNANPTVTITPVSPDPRKDPVSSIDIVFSKAIVPSGFTLADLSLKRDGGSELLPGAATLTNPSADNKTFILGNLSGLTGTAVSPKSTYVLTLADVTPFIQDSDGNALSGGATETWDLDTTVPTVTINQRTDPPAQADPAIGPTASTLINFTVEFSEEVNGFDTSDVDISTNTAGASTVTISEITARKKFNVAIGGMTQDGNVIATIKASAVTDDAGNTNGVSSSTDNTVAYKVDNFTTFVVNSTADTTDPQGCDITNCTLREAITAANADFGAETITFDPTVFASPGMLVNLTGPLPDLSTDMTISGPGANVLTVRRDTGGNYRIFNIASGSINVTIAGLTINNGDAGVGSGGGIFNNSTGTVNVNNCTISGNSAGADGGGILNSVAGTLNITNSTISGNTASQGQGAGLSILAASTVNITNSTISGNTATGNAGGIFNALATLTISNSTIANNRADSDNNASGVGGGIFRSSGTVTLKNTIVGDNLKGAATLQVETATVVGTITSAGNATVTVTAAGMNNSPKTLNVAVANADNAIAVAGKMRTALNADPDVSAFFTVSGTGTDKLIFTVKLAAPNDTTMNIAYANGTCTGLTADASSDDTTAGAAGDDISGTVQSDGFNLIQSGAVVQNPGAGPNVTGFDPQLNPLADNGGPTKTHSLKCTSRATDKGTAILTTLNEALDINSVQTTFNVTSAAYIPAGVGYTILIDSEQMVVISKSTNTLTVTRGANATTPATHANGTNVTPASSTDQRGGSRPFDLSDGAYPNAAGGDGSDIGAYETQSGGGCVPDAIAPAPQTTNEDIPIGPAPPSPGTAPITMTGTFSTNVQMTFTVTQSPAHGTLSDFSAPNCVFTTFMNCTETVKYTPAADYNGPDSFKFKAVTNPGGLESDEAEVTITVNPINDAPTFLNIASDTVNEDNGPQAMASFANSISPGPSNESGQTVAFTITGNNNTALFSVLPAIDPAGTLSYTPAPDANGSATITFVGKDNGGVLNGGVDTSTVHNFTINVTAVNDVPSFTKGADQAVAENAGAQTVGNWATNILKGPANESAQTLTFQVTNNTNPTLFSVAPAIGSTGTLTYTPATDTSGTADITLQLKDSGGTLNGGVDTSPTQTFKITVNDGGTLQFSSATYSVSENAGPAAITITRTGGSAGTATVQLATSNGTATSADYTSVNQTVTFNDGETSKTVNIPITDDLFNEPDETVNLTLSNVGGSGNLGTPLAAVLTIVNDDPTGGYIKFSLPNYNTTEASGSATITVQRLGTLTQAITVDYTTSDDSNPAQMVSCAPTLGNTIASSRCDFNTASGRLSWASGDGASKTFTVLINQDAYLEGPESLSLTLSNLTGGATFAIPSTATLTIADDDLVAPTSNTIDDANSFVIQHYHDFLNREPDAAGLAFWTNQITSCGSSTQCIEVRRINVSVAFFLSLEFQSTGGTAYLTNKVAFGGLPDYVRFESDAQAIGLNYVFGQPGAEAILEANRVAYYNDYVSRVEFTNTYGGVSDSTYVNTLIANTGVTFTQQERDALLNGLTNHTETRATVLRKISDKPSFRTIEFTRMFVLMEYFGYLRRNPDTPGFNFWLNKLNQFNGNYIDAEMVKAFINSTEYRARFGP